MKRKQATDYKDVDFKEVSRIKDDFIICKTDWDLYIYLFMNGIARINTLNNIAGAFFGRVQSNLIDNTVIRISRLTDPAKQRTYSNLSLELLRNYGEKHKMFGIHEKYREITKSVETIREYRHKIFVHRDFEVAQEHTPSTRIGILTLNQITRAIELIEAFVKDFFGELEYPKAIDIARILQLGPIADMKSENE